jgi:EmrB/QacA subfamily drug resistance transporter
MRHASLMSIAAQTPESARPQAARSWSTQIQDDHWGTLAVLLAGVFMIVLDFFIVNVALPSMQADLNASHSSTEWFVAAYGLTFATGLITAARLGDQVGRRRMFSLGLALFTLASVACAVAANADALILARLAQGLAAALISPQVLSIIGVKYTGADRVRALSIYGVVMGLGAIGGQIIGGVLIGADIAGLGWRAVFLINVPLGLFALALAPRLVPESRAANPARLDLIGALLLSAGLVALLLPLTEGRQDGWPAWAWLSLASAPLMLGLFAGYERRLARRGRSPLLPPALFAERTFSAGLATQLAFWCGQASFFLVLSLYLQQGRGLSALEAGLVFTILAVAFVAVSLRAPRWTMRYGRRLIAAGALILAGGDLLLLACVSVIGTGGSVAVLVPGLLLVGAGQGLCMTPLTTTVLLSLDPQRAGAATGVLSTMQQLGNALGVAITGVIFYGTLGGGFAHAFTMSLAELTALLLGVAALTRLLPERKAT